MPKSRPPYPAEFRQRMVEFVPSGRNPEDPVEKFEPSAQVIRNRVRQVDRDPGAPPGRSDERHELTLLRREVATPRGVPDRPMSRLT